MTRKQLLVLILLGLADCLVLGGLIAVVVLTPQLVGQPGTVETAVGSVTETTTSLPPTWTPTMTPSPAPSETPFPTRTPTRAVPTDTPVPIPTNTPAPTPTPAPIELENGEFDSISNYSIPGWEFEAVSNWEPGSHFDPNSSFLMPYFKPADDPRRFIDGTTLQIEPLHQYVKFRITIYQTIELPEGSTAQFVIQARGYSQDGGIQVRVGIDPHGRSACAGGSWSDTQVIDQSMDVTTLRSRQVTVGFEGLVTVCFFAEPEYASAHMAAFFDNAELIGRRAEE